MVYRLPFIVGLWLTLSSSAFVHAEDQRATMLNRNTIGLMVSEQAWLPLAQNFSHALDHADALRILPILGSGSVQTLSDLVFLQGVDAALVSSDALTYATQHALTADGKQRLYYTAKLDALNVVIIAKSSLSTLSSLEGKRIATGPVHSSSFATGEILFAALGMNFERVALSDNAAIAALRQDKADAVLLLGSSFDQSILTKGDWQILPIPLLPILQQTYAPAMLEAQDFPGLIDQGKTVETISSSLILAVFNWPRGNEHFLKLSKFTNALYANPNLGDADRGPINLATQVAGWPRFSAVDDVIKNNKGDQP